MVSGTRFITVVVFISAQFAPGVAAQDGDVRRLGAGDGLSHNTVLSILQDRRGFMWFGTADGLNRYDGFEFVVYRHDPFDTSSLSHNTVRELLEDDDGNLWVGTETSLDYFDRRTGRFTRHPIEPYNQDVSITGLARGDGDYLWVTRGSSLIRYDPQRRETEVFRPEGAGDQHPLFVSVEEDSSGRLWLPAGNAGPSALFRFDPSTRGFDFYSAPDAWGGDLKISRRGDGSFWFSTSEKIGILNPASGDLISDPSLEPGDILLEDRTGRLWLRRGSEIAVLDASGRVMRSFILDPSGTNALLSSISSVYEDASGGVWLATLGGLVRIDPSPRRFRNLGKEMGMSSDVVMAVHQDRSNTLWIGTLGGGVNAVDREGTVTHHTGGSRSENNVWALAKDSEGSLWAGTDAGLCLVRNSLQCLQETRTLQIYSIAFDAGGFWLATGSGLFRFAEGKLLHVPSRGHEGESSNVQDVLPEGEWIWVGTEFNGLKKIHLPSGSVKSYPYGTTTGEGTPGKAVRAIHPDSRDRRYLWLGTDMGLVRFDTTSETFRYYMDKDGLPGSHVYGIGQDGRGDLWVSTNRVLARYSRATGTFRHYEAADRTGNTEYNRRAAFRSTTGELFFGGIAGVTSFHPDSLGDEQAVPPVAITRIVRSNRDSTAVLDPEHLEDNRLILSHSDYTFSFEYAALAFSGAAGSEYAYRLDGFDMDWVRAGSRRFSTYTNVPPGDYVFRVRASNSDGLWGKREATLALTILPPFWQTWWFRLAAALAMIAMAAVAYRFRVAHLLRIERMRMRIAGDLHDDIGSKLGSIALMTEMVERRTPLAEREKRQLEEVSRTARGMADDLRDIVWMVDPARDGLEDLIAKMRRTATSLLDGTLGTFSGPAFGDLHRMSMEKRRHVYLMYKEALYNVARHAAASRIDVRIQSENGSLIVEIMDNGRGFDPSAGHPTNGLRNLERRAAQIGGTCDVVSREGEGTKIRISAPIA